MTKDQSVKVAIIAGITTVIGATIAIIPDVRNAGQPHKRLQASGAAVSRQESHGSQSPAVSATGGVTINYGEKDAFEGVVKPPRFGPIDLQIPYGYQVSGTDGAGVIRTVYGQPTSKRQGVPNEHSQDVVLKFDVTNPNAMEMRIAKVEVEVRSYGRLQHMQSTPLASAGFTRQFFCDLSSKPGLYPCKSLGNFDFIKLGRGELEDLGLNVNTREAGLYELVVWVDYAISSERKRVKVGDVGESVAFF